MTDDAAERLAQAEAEDDGPPTEVLPERVRTGAPEWASKVNPVTGLSIVPAQDEIRALASLANTFSTSGLVPYQLKDKPEDIFLVLLTARDNGVALTTALREFHPINGVVSMSPKVRHAMANQRAQEMGWRIWPDADNDEWQATWNCERDGVTISVTFTWEDARRAGLVGSGCEPNDHAEGCIKDQPSNGKAKAHCKSNWYEWPKRMLSQRARGFALDDALPEVATGLYSPDELGALTDEEGEPITIDAVDVPKGMKASKRQRRARGQERTAAPLTDDAQAAILRQIKALPEPAQTVLAEMWSKPREDQQGNVVGTFLPPLKHCDETHVRKIDALLKSVTQRAKRGEWGDWTEPTPEPTAEQVASEQDAQAEAPDEAPTQSDGGEVNAPVTSGAGEVGEEPAPPSDDEPDPFDGLPTMETLAAELERLTPNQSQWLTAAIAKEGLRPEAVENTPDGRRAFHALLAGAAMQAHEAPQDAPEPDDGPDDAETPADDPGRDLVAEAERLAARAREQRRK